MQSEQLIQSISTNAPCETLVHLVVHVSLCCCRLNSVYLYLSVYYTLYRDAHIFLYDLLRVEFKLVDRHENLLDFIFS